ncbi:hypothetical protein ACFQU2_20610 [Siccirubricoccus deserti]
MGAAQAGNLLYLRPTVIATDVMLGVHPAHSYLYFLILSPVGSYYKEGVKPVKILASDTHVRAVKGASARPRRRRIRREPGRPAGRRGGRLHPGALSRWRAAQIP